MEVDLDGLFRQNTSYDYDDDYEYEEDLGPIHTMGTWIPVLYSLVFVIGLLGNILLLIVLGHKRRTWSTSDTFILQLGIADILLLVMLPFWAAQAAQRCDWCSHSFCKISGAAFNINFYSGIFLLFCVSLDLYLPTVHAIQFYSHRRPLLVQISCASVWLASLLLTSPDWAFLEAQTDAAQEKTLCVHNYIHSGTDWLLLSRLPHLVVGFLLPAAALIICCLHLLQPKHISKGHKKQRAVMVILFLVGLFFLCWVPYNITLFVDTIKNNSKKSNSSSSGNPHGSSKSALIVTAALGCAHACVRPLLYFGLCANFRKQLLAILRRAPTESKSSLWELGVGDEAPPEQGHESVQLKQAAL
ncbi:C-X-C chemokine receptor type 3-like [Pholidichthys leucotaenia]